jgi:hypothetical protein
MDAQIGWGSRRDRRSESGGKRNMNSAALLPVLSTLLNPQACPFPCFRSCSPQSLYSVQYRRNDIVFTYLRLWSFGAQETSSKKCILFIDLALLRGSLEPNLQTESQD